MAKVGRASPVGLGPVGLLPAWIQAAGRRPQTTYGRGGSKVIPYSNPYVIGIVQKYDMAYVSEYGIIGNDGNRQPGTTPLGWAESGRHQTRPLRRGGQASRRPPTCQLGAQGVGRRASATGWGDTE